MPERETIANLIIQTDMTGVGRGITKVNGKHIVGHNSRNEAIGLCWNGRHHSVVTREILGEMFAEAKELQLNKPIRVYGTTCTVGETESFRFCQIPGTLRSDDTYVCHLCGTRLVYHVGLHVLCGSWFTVVPGQTVTVGKGLHTCG